jgi:ATP-dependent protease HslVU (ClpYQ) peptidase subunit
MTCIVGLEANGKVFLGGDIQGTGWNNKVVHTQPKVFNKKGVIFGYTTSYRFGQILEHGLQDPVIPEDETDIYRWLITTVVPDIRSALKAADYEGGGNCLIGVKGQLWELQNDFSVLRSVKGYGAVGSGYEYAMGSLFTQIAMHGKVQNTETPILIDAVATSILQTAIQAAGTYSPSVGTESTVISTSV